MSHTEESRVNSEEKRDSNEKKEEVSINIKETTVGDAIVKIFEDTQIVVHYHLAINNNNGQNDAQDIKNYEKNYTEANGSEDNEIQLILEEADKAATSTTVRSTGKMKRYRKAVFWVQHVEQREKKEIDLIPEGEEAPEKLDKLLNPRSHGVRWLQQEGMEPIPEKQEFHYDPKKNNDLVKVFSILLAMFLVTAALQYFYLKIVLFEVKTNIYIHFWTPPPQKKFNYLMPVYSGYAHIALSMLALLMINYFWTCTSWSKDNLYALYISLVLGLLAMSWLIISLTIQYDTYAWFFALYGSIVATLVCLLLSLIPVPKINFTSWCLYVVVLVAVFAAMVVAASLTMVAYPLFTHDDALYSFMATIIVVFLLILELQLVLTYRTVRIDENEYALVACLMFVSSFTIIVKLILAFDVIDAE